jgi:SAM-dependent methyltransferase
VISAGLLALVRCPDCHGLMDEMGETLVCRSCGHRAARGAGYLDLRPTASFTEQTKYLDEALHADARHETVSPALLQAGVRQWMLQRFLKPGPGDVIVDLGCGSGRSLVWNAASGASMIGIDVAPFFATEALSGADLVLGDLRRLPFGDGVFRKGYALDVFEHLSREGLAEVLREIARVTAPGGWIFAYSHVRKNSWLAGGLKAVNAVARGLDRVGLIDLRQERLRKSDHLNPLADVPDLEATVAAAGFRVARIRYYTPLIGAVVENLLMRMAERALARRSAPPLATGSAAGSAAESATPSTAGRSADSDVAAIEQARRARLAAKRRLASGGALYHVLRAVTWVMTLDVRVLGHVRTGPFFVLLERLPATPTPPAGPS